MHCGTLFPFPNYSSLNIVTTLEIVLEQQTDTFGKINVSVDKTDYLDRYNSKIKEYGRKVKINGFRPGKVPMGMIVKMYGQSIMFDEVNSLVSSSVNSYIKDNKINIIGEPLPDADSYRQVKWVPGENFRFVYKLGLIPSFEYKVAKGQLTKYAIKFDDKNLEQSIEELRKSYPKASTPEVSAKDDYLAGTLTEVGGEFSSQAMLPTGKVKEAELQKFVGLKIGDTVTFRIKDIFDDNSYVQHLLGAKADEVDTLGEEFSLQVSRITRSEPADFTQDFFDNVLGKDVAKTEEEFKEKIAETIKGNYVREAEGKFLNDLRKHLTENVDLSLSEEFLKEWLEATKKEDTDIDELLENFDEIMKDAKWQVIRNRVVEDFKIEVTADDVKNRVRDMVMSQYGMYAAGDKFGDVIEQIVQNYISAENGKNFMNIFDQLLFERSFSAYAATVDSVTKEVSMEEFKAL